MVSLLLDFTTSLYLLKGAATYFDAFSSVYYLYCYGQEIGNRESGIGNREHYSNYYTHDYKAYPVKAKGNRKEWFTGIKFPPD
ncbi:MAG: hypothetical protein F6K26_26410 [Moorea sp. SIO2I5]|nr:hypothetical protein [Moorena sp. SIO2I5]